MNEVSLETTLSATTIRCCKAKCRYTLPGCKMMVYEHLDGSMSLRYGPHVVGRYDAAGASIQSANATRARTESNCQQARLAVEMTPTAIIAG
jgi:hypothetical protein